MSLDRQIRRLERRAARLAALHPPAPEPAGIGWAAALAEVGPLLASAAGRDALAAYADHDQQVRQFYAQLWPPGGAARRQIEDPELKPAATVLFFARLPPDLRARAADPAALACGGWANKWIGRLANLISRIPPDVSPDLLRRLAAPFADSPPDQDVWEEVCLGCGLRRPFWPDYPWHGAPCGHCGGTRMTLPYADPGGGEWRELARRELAAVGRAGGAARAKPRRAAAPPESKPPGG
ncbi:hypothetical protein [Urbifossiella limnaea]|uniref:Uncharacterized protein n=1 Tax=Urbifossiella limnaea TaxID=2528023 RepID=A0A517Y378_9BACT|nr:hypothetical protein [Urbifossiella limnaea]QDU24199.1 hypothetical protein ETAA1_62130 [Urbifossiella limnaea]